MIQLIERIKAEKQKKAAGKEYGGGKSKEDALLMQAYERLQTKDEEFTSTSPLKYRSPAPLLQDFKMPLREVKTIKSSKASSNAAPASSTSKQSQKSFSNIVHRRGSSVAASNTGKSAKESSST